MPLSAECLGGGGCKVWVLREVCKARTHAAQEKEGRQATEGRTATNACKTSLPCSLSSFPPQASSPSSPSSHSPSRGTCILILYSLTLLLPMLIPSSLSPINCIFSSRCCGWCHICCCCCYCNSYYCCCCCCRLSAGASGCCFFLLFFRPSLPRSLLSLQEEI